MHHATHVEPMTNANEKLLSVPTFYLSNMESATSSPVPALHVSNRTEFHRVALLLLEQPLGLDASTLDHYDSPETVLNLLCREHPHQTPQNHWFL
jgi:hypothetical protein